MWATSSRSQATLPGGSRLFNEAVYGKRRGGGKRGRFVIKATAPFHLRRHHPLSTSIVKSTPADTLTRKAGRRVLPACLCRRRRCCDSGATGGRAGSGWIVVAVSDLGTNDKAGSDGCPSLITSWGAEGSGVRPSGSMPGPQGRRHWDTASRQPDGAELEPTAVDSAT